VLRWRVLLAGFLVPALAVPLILPLARLGSPAAWDSWREADRLLPLAGNTLLLVGGTLLVALPAGTLAALLLYRTDLPGRGWLRALLVGALFVPLPLFTSGWQTALGADGLLPLPLWSVASEWAPWSQGLGAAVWIHGVAALPWVVLIVGLGLCWVERELEEDALTAAPPWRVLLAVVLPRARPALAAAALWVSLQAATEITVTDVMQVRTFAEEVYTQLAASELTGFEGLSRAAAVTFPQVLLTALLVVLLVRRWEHRLPSRQTLDRPPWVYRLGPERWPAALLVGLTAAALIGFPLASLVWRAGLQGRPPAWSPLTVLVYLRRACRPPDGGLLLANLLLAVAAGLLLASLALVTCWAMRRAPLFRGGVLALMAVAWSLPGPLLGLSLLAVIQAVLRAFPSPWLSRALYQGPSPLPLLWVDVIRFYPSAVAVLFPVVRLLPDELIDAARVEGATPARELGRVVWPLTAGAWLQAAVAVGILSLGELSASKIVETPGMPGYATLIFTQMHFGVRNDLAAQCLLLLLVVAAGTLLLAAVRWWLARAGISATKRAKEPHPR
jgi:iron(III) transport system permease protein